MNNHDTQRIVTRLGRLNANDPAAWTGNNLVYVDAPIDLELGRRRARAADHPAAALPGALYLYQGEEMGLEEYLDMPERPVRIRCSSAPAARSSAAMGAVCRCRGRRIQRHRSASRRLRPSNALAAAARELGRAFGRAGSSRSTIHAVVVSHVARTSATVVGRADVGRHRPARVPGLRTRWCVGRRQRRCWTRSTFRPTWLQDRSVILASNQTPRRPTSRRIPAYGCRPPTESDKSASETRQDSIKFPRCVT